jgi:hypothetical protein
VLSILQEEGERRHWEEIGRGTTDRHKASGAENHGLNEEKLRRVLKITKDAWRNSFILVGTRVKLATNKLLHVLKTTHNNIKVNSTGIQFKLVMVIGNKTRTISQTKVP